ncbi:hypothetical protein SISSUDRAFT_1060688 [Sistotremastrum suecicum HHB10207 ss-3]|uniref:Mid2 domain-containing protein n=1 Tax=Sistotremastrum suecicum HHB10207 ss-3 TaxID=1314776 RepID=A0A166EWR7_9AGAM|nr:hypothetical protein SISSUDRAFT_1060688 [Sistotremastrum suecicum HHB10207 ss-3]
MARVARSLFFLFTLVSLALLVDAGALEARVEGQASSTAATTGLSTTALTSAATTAPLTTPPTTTTTSTTPTTTSTTSDTSDTSTSTTSTDTTQTTSTTSSDTSTSSTSSTSSSSPTPTPTPTDTNTTSESTSESVVTGPSGTSTVVVTETGPPTDTSTSPAATSSAPSDDGSGDGIKTSTIIGLSVAGGVAVLGIVAFIIWKLTRKRFSDFDVDGEAIKWPELTHESHALPTRATGRAGIDDDGGVGTGLDRNDSALFSGTSTAAASMTDLHHSNDPYAVPPLPQFDPNQPYRDDPGAYHGQDAYYDPYRGPVPQTIYDPAAAPETIPMNTYSAPGYAPPAGYARTGSPGPRSRSPGPIQAYGVDNGRRSPGPGAAYGMDPGRRSPGPGAAYGGRQSPGPAMAYGPDQGRRSPGPQQAFQVAGPGSEGHSM